MKSLILLITGPNVKAPEEEIPKFANNNFINLWLIFLRIQYLLDTKLHVAINLIDYFNEKNVQYRY